MRDIYIYLSKKGKESPQGTFMYHVYTDANLTHSISFQNVLYKYDVPNYGTPGLP